MYQVYPDLQISLKYDFVSTLHLAILHERPTIFIVAPVVAPYSALGTPVGRSQEAPIPI